MLTECLSPNPDFRLDQENLYTKLMKKPTFNSGFFLTLPPVVADYNITNQN